MTAQDPVIRLDVEARDNRARAGTITTARGTITTPCFMPVGTRGAVRAIGTDDLEMLAPQVVLANTYHLMLRPGVETVSALGGLHEFMDWSGHLLTDSGGFQVFSLAPEVDDDGVTFRSTYDGSTHHLSPEEAASIQRRLGADIQMVLDVCPPLPSPVEVVREAVERTASWARRARVGHLQARAEGDTQAQFGIVQGGVDAALRRESGERTREVGFDGYAVGGLSVGESRDELLAALHAALGVLPNDQPRYLMGVGDPVGMLHAIAAGVDLFDSVLPTRLARHGTVLTDAGRLNLRNARFAEDQERLDATCGCGTCLRYSRGYLRHLLQVGESAAARYLTIHNVWWSLRLIEHAREAIIDGRLDQMVDRVEGRWT